MGEAERCCKAGISSKGFEYVKNPQFVEEPMALDATLSRVREGTQHDATKRSERGTARHGMGRCGITQQALHSHGIIWHYTAK
jgi:hypothetical protein